MLDRTQLHPPWREALQKFLEEKFAPGDLIAFDWFYQAFSMVQPSDDTPLGVAQKVELQFLAQFKSLENALLTGHQIALSNERGLGYRIVPPPEQTRWSEDAGNVELRKTLQKRIRRLTNVNFDALSAIGRRENADAIARVGMLTSMSRQAIERKSALDPDDLEE